MGIWLTRTGLCIAYTLLTWWLGALVAMVALNMLLDAAVTVTPFDLTAAKVLVTQTTGSVVLADCDGACAV